MDVVPISRFNLTQIYTPTKFHLIYGEWIYLSFKWVNQTIKTNNTRKNASKFSKSQDKTEVKKITKNK